MVTSHGTHNRWQKIWEVLYGDRGVMGQIANATAPLLALPSSSLLFQNGDTVFPNVTRTADAIVPLVVPRFPQKSLIFSQKSLIFSQKSPIFSQTSPTRVSLGNTVSLNDTHILRYCAPGRALISKRASSHSLITQPHHRASSHSLIFSQKSLNVSNVCAQGQSRDDYNDSHFLRLYGCLLATSSLAQ